MMQSAEMNFLRSAAECIHLEFKRTTEKLSQLSIYNPKEETDKRNKNLYEYV
jgi:hypothetical protein